MSIILGKLTPEEKQSISMGAEATISSALFLNHPVILKHRIPKAYRNKKIDNKLRKERSIQEIRLLMQSLDAGLPVPRVYDLDKKSWTIIMEEKKGVPIKQIIDQTEENSTQFSQLENVFTNLGRIIGKMHSINVIHGDLTTSNILIDEQYNIALIDFGLGFTSVHVEDQAVDLLVLKHVLESSHPDLASTLMIILMTAYKSEYPNGKAVEKRMQVVEGRVRYKTHEE